MKKDIIYIDIEDDITTVIEKLRESKENIVALVPPKGNQVLHSIVNLKLLKRAAESAGKQPVLVTGNKALTRLAGGLSLYTAKNLQTKPVIPGAPEEVAEEITDEPIEVNNAEEVVEEAGAESVEPEEVGDEIELGDEDMKDLEDESDETAAKDASKAVAAKKLSDSKSSANKKVPNFDNFRKKLLIGLALLLLLVIGLLVIFGKTKANVAIRAETTPVDIMFDAKVDASLPQSDPTSYAIKAQAQESKKSVSQAFIATGEKDVGQTATGTVVFSTRDIDMLDSTIPAGTVLTSSSGAKYTTDSGVTFTRSNYKGAKVGITATAKGAKYNGASGPVSGVPAGVKAEISGATSGGTDKIVKIVTQADVDKAKADFGQPDAAAAKEELKKAFAPEMRVLDDSFVMNVGNVHSEPGVGEEANDARVTAEVTYSMLGVNNDDLKKAMDAFVTTKMTDKEKQQVYGDSLKAIQLAKTGGDAKSTTYKITSRGQFGPQFDEDELKQKITGKKSGEVRSILLDLPGVKGVDLHLSPFWANKTPNPSRIQIKIDVDENTSA